MENPNTPLLTDGGESNDQTARSYDVGAQPAAAAAPSTPAASTAKATTDIGTGQVLPPSHVSGTVEDGQGGFGKVYHGLLDIMGGKVDRHYTVNKETGKTEVTTTPRTPGQQWAHVVSAALAGLGAGGDAKNAFTALGKGAAAGRAQVQTEDKQGRANANKQFENQKQADEMTLRKASNAREQQESILKAQEYSNRFKKFDYDFEQEAGHDKQELVDRWNNRTMAGVQPLLVEGKPVPEFSSLKEANDYAMQNRKAVIGGYTTRIDIDPSTHKFVLGQVPQEKQAFKVQVPDGQGGFKEGTIFGTPTDYLGYQNKQAELRRDAALAQEASMRISSMKIDLKDKQKLDTASTNWRKALQATGGDPEKAVAYLKQNYPADAAFLQEHELDQLSGKSGYPIFSNGVGEQKDPFGAQLAVKAHKDFTKEMAAFQKEYVLPANGVEKSYQMSDMAYREYLKAKAQGKNLSTGAQSMVMLSNHLNTTFGQVKGARITKDMIHEHLGARSIPDEAVVAIQRLTNGDALSPAQWDSFHELISESRNQTWTQAADQAMNQGLPRNFMPRGNGRYIDDDPGTAKLFYQLAEESPARAREAAQYFGWKVGKPAKGQ